MTQKISICAPSYNIIGLYLRNWGTYRESEKTLNSNVSPTFSQYGKLRPTGGWDLLASLGHPSKFQRVSHLGSFTAQGSSSLHQPNFAALNRDRHLYSAGQPSRWALTHILVIWLVFGGFELFDIYLRIALVYWYHYSCGLNAKPLCMPAWWPLP